MARPSTTLFYIINWLSLLLGLAAVSASLYFRLHGSATDCQRALQNPLLLVGVVLSVVSLLGLVGACSRSTWALVFYFAALVVLLLALIAFTIFVLVVTSKGTATKLHHLGLDDYSGWLKNHFIHGKNWDDIRSCVADSKICQSINYNSNAKVSDFLKKNLSPIQAGCCRPPDNCALERKNTTYSKTDCEAWGSEALCYDCESCKRGVLATIRKQWRVLALLNALAIALVVVTLAIACCAMNNSKEPYYN